MRKVLAIVLACLAIASLAACSKSSPNESDARSVYVNLLKQQLGAVPYVLVSFKKTNGVAREVMGSQTYAVEYQAVVEYPAGVRPECVSRNGSFPGWRCSIAASQGLRPKSVGEREVMAGELIFEKTERGWKGQDGNLY